MAPKKPNTKEPVSNSSVNAGVVKKTRSATKGTNTIQPTATASMSKSKYKALTTNPAPVTSISRKSNTIHKTPATTSGRSKKTKDIKTSSHQTPTRDMVSSPPVASFSDIEAGPSTLPKLAAFHEARGSFEDLYIQPDYNDTFSDAAPATKKTPQKATTAAMKATGDASPTKRTSQRFKRKRESDDSPVDGANSSSPSLAKHPTIKLKKPSSTPSSPTRKRSLENDVEETITQAPTAKRLKINVGNPPPSTDPTPATAAVAATTPATAIKSKAKGGPVITKNGKVKKTPEYAVEHAFEGTPSNHGTSLERPEFGSLDRPWFCANLGCCTGMTWVPRDHKDPVTGKGPMGRKVISQFFGRNKGPTKLIPNDVWHFYCRKDYQRSRYAAEHGSSDELARQVIRNLRDQLIRLKLWRPDALFQVQLDKGATDRLNAYFAALRQHNNDEAAALASLPGPKDPKKEKPEEVFPPALSETFNQRFKTAGKAATATYDDIEAIIAWSEAEITAGRSTVLVPCEFLINPTQPDETVNDISNNFAQWEVTRDEHVADISPDEPLADVASSEVPTAKKASKGKGKAIIKPEETEADTSDAASEPVTPTPAPRARGGIIPIPRSEDPMAIMHILNHEAESIGYHARTDSS